jgi:hypothetical protein
MLLLQRQSQRDISITNNFCVDQPGLSNKRFRLWLASRSQSNLTRWAQAAQLGNHFLFSLFGQDTNEKQEECIHSNHRDQNFLPLWH